MPERFLKRKYDYRRRLPHFQCDYRALFVTFTTANRWQLPAVARSITLDCVLQQNQVIYDLEALVVMPDHVHMIFMPLPNGDGDSYSLPQIMRKLKGVSAHLINKYLDRKGSVWQSEFFDHVIRHSESLDEKIDYLLMNPVRGDLVLHPQDYKWSWQKDAGEAARATQAKAF